jgi:ligand-binding sensor domain-containing protein
MTRGCFLYDGVNIIPFKTEVDNYLLEKKLYHGIRFSSGDFALATRLGGLVIMDNHGKVKEIFNKQSGLQDENVKYVFEDFQGNLWLGLSYGISKIEYASPLSLYDERAYLPRIVLSAARYRQG